MQNTIENNNFARPIKKDNNVEIDRENVKNDTRGVQEMGFIRRENRIIEEAKTILKGRDGGANQAKQQGCDGSQFDADTKGQETDVEAWAKVNSLWRDDATEWLEERYGKKIGSGAESFVFCHDGHTVIKVRDITGYNNLLEALESIEIHNKLFPETAMKVLGFGRSDDEFAIVFTQSFVEGEHPTNEEIETYVYLKFGAVKDEGVIGGTSYKTDEYLLQDLKPQNVIISNGRFFVIDGDFYYTRKC